MYNVHKKKNEIMIITIYYIITFISNMDVVTSLPVCCCHGYCFYSDIKTLTNIMITVILSSMYTGES